MRKQYEGPSQSEQQGEPLHARPRWDDPRGEPEVADLRPAGRGDAQRPADAQRQYELARRHAAQRRAKHRQRQLRQQSAQPEERQPSQARPDRRSAPIERAPTLGFELVGAAQPSPASERAVELLMSARQDAAVPTGPVLSPQATQHWEATRKRSEQLQREAARERAEVEQREEARRRALKRATAHELEEAHRQAEALEREAARLREAAHQRVLAREAEAERERRAERILAEARASERERQAQRVLAEAQAMERERQAQRVLAEAQAMEREQRALAEAQAMEREQRALAEAQAAAERAQWALAEARAAERERSIDEAEYAASARWEADASQQQTSPAPKPAQSRDASSRRPNARRRPAAEESGLMLTGRARPSTTDARRDPHPRQARGAVTARTLAVGREPLASDPLDATLGRVASSRLDAKRDGKRRPPPPPLPPAARARSTGKPLLIPPPPAAASAIAPPAFEEVFLRRIEARPAAAERHDERAERAAERGSHAGSKPRASAPSAPASRQSLAPMRSMYVSGFADTHEAPLEAQRGSRSSEPMRPPAWGTQTAETPAPARTFGHAFADLARGAVSFASARPSTRAGADDASITLSQSRPASARLVPYAAALMVLALGTAWAMHSLRGSAPPSGAMVVSSPHGVQPGTPIVAELPAGSALSPAAPTPTTEPLAETAASQRHDARAARVGDASQPSAADLDTEGNSRLAQRRLAHEQRVAARRERRRLAQLARQGGESGRKRRAASSERGSHPAAARPGSEVAPSVARRSAAAAPVEAREPSASPASAKSARSAPPQASPSSRRAAAQPSPAPQAPPSAKKAAPMDDLLDRVGPAKRSPSKPASDADLELDDLLKKSIGAGR
jgi:hypothetical protein